MFALPQDPVHRVGPSLSIRSCLERPNVGVAPVPIFSWSWVYIGPFMTSLAHTIAHDGVCALPVPLPACRVGDRVLCLVDRVPEEVERASLSEGGDDRARHLRRRPRIAGELDSQRPGKRIDQRTDRVRRTVGRTVTRVVDRLEAVGDRRRCPGYRGDAADVVRASAPVVRVLVEVVEEGVQPRARRRVRTLAVEVVPRRVGVTCDGDQHGRNQKRCHEHHAQRDDHREPVLGAQAALRTMRGSAEGVEVH